MLNSDHHRWKTAVHESGHAVAAIALGGRCREVDLLDIAGRAGAAALAELSGTDSAFATAAGPAAERLAATHGAPSEPITIAEPMPEPVAVDGVVCPWATLRRASEQRPAPSDDMQLAEWAIAGHSDDPDSWARRVRFAHRVAGEIVRDHEAAIVRLATELFLRGRLNETEILETINQSRALELVK